MKLRQVTSANRLLLVIAISAGSVMAIWLLFFGLSGLSPYEQLVKEGAQIRARAPYVMFRPTPNPGDINSLGFRSPEIDTVKSPYEFRFAMLGSSAVFGSLPHETTLPGMLAETLKESIPSLRHKEITYVNAGIVSAVSGQELAQLVYHLLGLDLDLLIVFDGFNDMYIPLHGYDPRPGYPYDYIVQEYRYYKFTSAPVWWKFFTSLWEKHLARKNPKPLVERYLDELEIEIPPLESRKEEIVDIYFRNLSKMVAIAKAYNIRTAVFLQPYSAEHVHPNNRESFAHFEEMYARASERFAELSRENSPSRINRLMMEITLC